MKRYDRLTKLVAFNKPKQIIEIGTHRGKRAGLICNEALKHNSTVHYIGYDLFEAATDVTNKREMNGKGAGSEARAIEILESIKKQHPGFTYEFVRGDTRQTLHGTDQRVDFVFIDGGHSVATIKGDYEAVKHSRLIVFDDFYTGNRPEGFGCNDVVARLSHELMPEEDFANGIGIRLAVVGYSSKWEAAIGRVIKTDGHKSVVLWRGEPIERADLVCAVNTLEGVLDLESALDELRKSVQRRLFFVIKADAIRSLEVWRRTLDKFFHIQEWFSPNDEEVVGTAMPLNVVGEWKSIGAVAEDQRLENTKYSVTLTSKRIRPLIDADRNFVTHGRRALIVGYGPSLRDSWTSILGEKRLCQDEADIISMSGSHDFLLRRDIVPDFHVECDPRPHKALNLTRPDERVKYYIASCCHPDLTNKLKDFDLSLWHLMNGPESFRIGEEIESERDEPLVCGGGSVGLRSIALFYGLGYRQFTLYGMDCSFGPAKDGTPVDNRDQEIQRWAGIHKGKKKDVIKVRCGERWFLTSPVDVTYIRHFVDTLQRSPDASFSIVGDSLLHEYVKQMRQEKAA